MTADIANAQAEWVFQSFGKLDELSDSMRFRCKLVCADCDRQLNMTSEFSKQELRSAWTHLVFSSALMALWAAQLARKVYGEKPRPIADDDPLAWWCLTEAIATGGPS